MTTIYIYFLSHVQWIVWYWYWWNFISNILFRISLNWEETPTDIKPVASSLLCRLYPNSCSAHCNHHSFDKIMKKQATNGMNTFNWWLVQVPMSYFKVQLLRIVGLIESCSFGLFGWKGFKIVISYRKPSLLKPYTVSSETGDFWLTKGINWYQYIGCIMKCLVMKGQNLIKILKRPTTMKHQGPTPPSSPPSSHSGLSTILLRACNSSLSLFWMIPSGQW